MLSTRLDFLIIGQGLAGSLLAWELIKRNSRVLVIDNGLENASLCAAGLINPITGMRFVKSFQVDLLLPAAKKYYQQLSNFFQQHFYVEKDMLRIFKSEKELHNAQKRLHDSNYQAYLGKITQTAQFYAAFGLIEQKQTAYLLTQPLLSALKQFFIEQQSYLQQQFSYEELTLLPELNWRGVKVKQVIFCEGYKVQNNPWFSTLPLQPAKGEILTLETTKPLATKILNYGHWLIPLDTHLYRTGATFEPLQLDTNCTEAAQKQLLSSLQRILPDVGTAKLQKQQANIRPTTLDKQPFIGSHPRYRQLGIFNGFGAKGSLQIPYYCQQFADYLLKNESFDSSANISRYALNQLHL
jgi:glycine/D-amino acid oxidase-like deaminating enzyme